MKYTYIILLALLTTSCYKNMQNKTARELIFDSFADKNFIAVNDYNFIKENQKTNFLNENFNDNSNNWQVYSQGTLVDFPFSYASILEGTYQINGDYNDIAFYIEKAIDTAKDFEIETYLSNLNDFSGSSFFGINGVFLFADVVNQKVNGVMVSMKDNNIQQGMKFNNTTQNSDQGDFNYIEGTNKQAYLITIRKIKNNVGFFVNGNFLGIYSFSSINFNGNKIGFRANNRMTIDYLKINYITL
jgi:hypothetical protein